MFTIFWLFSDYFELFCGVRCFTFWVDQSLYFPYALRATWLLTSTCSSAHICWNLLEFVWKNHVPLFYTAFVILFSKFAKSIAYYIFWVWTRRICLFSSFHFVLDAFICYLVDSSPWIISLFPCQLMVIRIYCWFELLQKCLNRLKDLKTRW